MLYRIIFAILLIALYSVINAQPRAISPEPVIQKVTLYYNGAAELTTLDKATFKREVEMNITAMVFHGVYQDFDLQENLIEEGYFHEGHKQGLVNQYFNNRQLKSAIDFSDHDFVIWQLKNDLKEDVVINGSGKFSIPFFYGTGTTLQPRWKQGILEGEFKFGKRVGTWYYLDFTKNKMDEEVYEMGRFINRIHYEKDNIQQLDYPKEILLSLNKLFEEVFAFDQIAHTNLAKSMFGGIQYASNFKRPPTFAGGLKRLLLLLAAQTPLQEGEQLVIRLSINEDGLVNNSLVEQGISPQIDGVFLSKIRGLEGKFFPAIKKGKPYSSILYLPFYGGQTGLKLIKDLPYDFIQEEF